MGQTNDLLIFSVGIDKAEKTLNDLIVRQIVGDWVSISSTFYLRFFLYESAFVLSPKPKRY
jgi:hypothetical protein